MASTPNPVLIAVGWLLTILGGLWTLLAGGCTLWFLGMALTTSSQSVYGGLRTLPFALLWGAVAVAPGVFMLWGGIAILRNQRKAS